MIELLDLNLVIDHLKTNVTAFKSRVSGAVNIETAIAQGFEVGPVAKVLPNTSRGGGNNYAHLPSVVAQEVTEQFGVLYGVRNVSDARGKAAHDELVAIRNATWSALLGWKPARQFKQVVFVSGRLTSMNNRVLWWGDIFQTQSLIQKV